MVGAGSSEHQNPDYYAETASMGNKPPQYQEYVNQYPPPASTYDAGAAEEHPPPMPPRPQQHYYPSPGPASEEFMAGGNGSGEPNADGSSSSKPTVRERLFQWSTRIGVPVNKLTNKLGSEAWWPSTLDIECDKAARILQSFASMWISDVPFSATFANSTDLTSPFPF